MTVQSEEIRLLKLMVRGSYDLQQLRIAAGLRLCANFRAKLKDTDSLHDNPNVPGDPTGQSRVLEQELSPDAEKLIDRLRDSYRRLTDGIARNRTLPAAEGFQGDELISTYTEIVLANQYFALEEQERRQFRQLEANLDPIPIYAEYLSEVRGVGPALAAVLISYFDPHKARHVSSFWKYAGLDVAPDGAGRSRRKEHLIEREYVDRNGRTAVRQSVTFEPWLKTKLMGVLAPSFLRTNSPWREAFDNYKHRIISDPNRQKVTLAEWKKRHAAGDPNMRELWAPGRIKDAALRYMVKQFLAELWLKWRELEGLPVGNSYPVAKLGMKPHKAA
jgi:hypothetical protein